MNHAVTLTLPAADILYDLSPSPLIKQQASLESEVRSYPRRLPIAITKAFDAYVLDERNQVYLDCLSNAGVLALGHNHPEIIQAITQALTDQIPLQTLDLTTPAKDAFMRALLNALPENFSKHAKLQFCGPTGSDAVEAAIKLAKTVTGRSAIFSFYGSYHGMTNGSLSATSNLSKKSGIANLMPEVHFMPYPYQYRSPFTAASEAALVEQSLRHLRYQLYDPEGGVSKPAAIILEVVQGEGGAVPAPLSWLRGLRALCDEYDILLIIDEVQTGFGRTGKMFAFEHADIVPDILVMSKAIGGGLPLAVLAFNQKFDQWKPGAHTGTFRGNQLAMVAGRKTLEIIERDKLVQHAAELGHYLTHELRAIQAQFPEIGDVRGRGLMLGIEFVDGGGRCDSLGDPLANADFAKKVQFEALRRGLICELGGRFGAVMRLLPPLTLNKKQADFVVRVIRDAVAAASIG